MDLRTFIQDLNGDLAREYAAAIQYFQHASTLTGLYFAFVGELSDHGAEEVSHAKLLNEHINFLGGIPLTAVAPTYSASSSIEMLMQDRVAEADAVARYTERIGQAQELGLMGTIALLQDILKDEENHLNDIRSILSV